MKSYRKIILLASLLGVCACEAEDGSPFDLETGSQGLEKSQCVFYVDEAIEEEGDGLSWSTAFGSVERGLEAAQETAEISGHRCEVKVSEETEVSEELASSYAYDSKGPVVLSFTGEENTGSADAFVAGRPHEDLLTQNEVIEPDDKLSENEDVDNDSANIIMDSFADVLGDEVPRSYSTADTITITDPSPNLGTDLNMYFGDSYWWTLRHDYGYGFKIVEMPGYIERLLVSRGTAPYIKLTGDLNITGSNGDVMTSLLPSTTSSGQDSGLRFCEDHDCTYGMYWYYDGVANRLRLYGKSGSSIYGPHISVNRTNGYVGINTDTPDNELDVLGTIRANEIIVETGWSDFVFEDDYNLPSLSQVKSFIDENGHLPDVPSARDVVSNGVPLGEAQTRLLQKVEELTLYLIEQNETIAEQNERISYLEQMLNNAQ